MVQDIALFFILPLEPSEFFVLQLAVFCIFCILLRSQCFIRAPPDVLSFTLVAPLVFVLFLMKLVTFRCHALLARVNSIDYFKLGPCGEGVKWNISRHSLD